MLVAFTDVQRRLIPVANLPKTPSTTTPSTPYTFTAPDSDAESYTPLHRSEVTTPATNDLDLEYINDLQTNYFTAQNCRNSPPKASISTTSRRQSVQIDDPADHESHTTSPRSVSAQIGDDVGVDASLVRTVFEKLLEEQQ